MLHAAPTLMKLLSQRKLVDQFSIVATLTEDLAHKAVHVPERRTHKKRVFESTSAKRPRITVRRRTSETSSPNKPIRSLRELEAESSIDESEAKEGFLDEKSGEIIYLIERIIKYEPQRGYLVHWQGYGRADRTWQSPKDMPAIFGPEMKQARERFRDTKRGIYQDFDN